MTDAISVVIMVISALLVGMALGGLCAVWWLSLELPYQDEEVS